MGLDLRLAARSHRPSTTVTAGSTSGPVAARTTTPEHGMAARGTLKLDNTTFQVDGRGVVRPPVGRLHQRRRRRLGLVRGQPRRRHRPDAVARPRRRWQLSAGLRDPGPPNATTEHLDRNEFTVDVTGTGRARRRVRPTLLGGRSTCPTTSSRSTLRRRSPTRSSTPARRPASSTGRAHRWSRRGEGRVAARRRGRGVRRADRLRAGSVGAHRVRGATDALSDQPGAVSGGRSRPAVVASARVWASRPARRSSTASIRVAPSLYARSLVIDAVNASWAMRSIDP